MDKLKAMQTIVSIADQGSLTAAAVVLDTSLPSVVRTLATLESYLGVRLFNRTTRSISPTEEGRYYIENCRELLATINEVESALNNDASEPNGLLTLTAPVQFGQMYVAPAVTRFVQKYDKMRVNLIFLDRVVNLVEENIDVGIRIGALEDSSLVAQSLGKVCRVVVASPGYLNRHGEPQHPKELLHVNCIRFSGGAGPWWTFHENGKQFDVPVTGNLEFNQVAPTVDACLAGLGFGMFISYQVNEHIKQKRLRVVLESFQPQPRPINVIYPSGRLLPARTKVFIEWIKNEIRTLLPEAGGSM
ncbi:MAG: LysR family transcriptional regulator [Gammaproteobacteria bacterium]|jgi:DNA-binding transcriptional LysR family regulator|nr:LysR family transcriptional regulator [Gammaproteobacteria bacterium]